MTTAQTGSKVRIHYTGTLDDGTVFDSSDGREPLEFVLGEGQVIPGFEQGVMGMVVGDSRTLNIPVDQAYGPRHDEAVFEIPRSDLPPNVPLEGGMQLQGQNQGRPVNVTVVGFDDRTVKMDANHPLAGKDLTFQIELVGLD